MKCSLKAYLITSGLIFALITGLHIWRMIAEGHADPLMILLTLLPAALCIWAFALVWKS